MKIVLYDVFGFRRIDGDYESLVDCMVQNKYDLRYMDFRGVDFRDEDFKGVDLSFADFRDVELSAATFRNVYFGFAIFRKANFYCMSLENTDLRGVDVPCDKLYDVKSTDTKLDYRLLKIQGSRHLFCGYGGMIRIGCEYHSVDDWLVHGAYTSTYSESERDEYMEYIKIYSKIWEEERWE
jgi:hypothetical protein